MLLFLGTKELSLAHALVSAGVTYAISEACTRSDFPYCTCFDGHRLKESALLEENEESVDGSLEDANNVENFAVQTAADIRATYQWQGCLRNVDYGATMARRFLDSQERSHITPYSLVNLHNNLVGRKVSSKMIKSFEIRNIFLLSFFSLLKTPRAGSVVSATASAAPVRRRPAGGRTEGTGEGASLPPSPTTSSAATWPPRRSAWAGCWTAVEAI